MFEPLTFLIHWKPLAIGLNLKGKREIQKVIKNMYKKTTLQSGFIYVRGG